MELNKQNFKDAAEDLGFEVSFGNPPEKAGFLNTDTGELTPWEDVWKNMFKANGLNKVKVDI